MNLIELIFAVIAVVCAFIGARWGLLGVIIGLVTPFIIARLALFISGFWYSHTRQGRRQKIAESAFDATTKEKRLQSWSRRPRIGRDGSTIVTIFYGQTKPPKRAFYKFTGDSMEPLPVSPQDIGNIIQIPEMK